MGFAEGSEIVDGTLSVSVTITLEDGWTLVPIPYPIPDSQIGDNGWQFGLEVTYDNFLGSMYDFYFDGYVNIAFGEEEKLKAWKINPKFRNVDMGPLNFDFVFTQEFRTDEKEDGETGNILREYTRDSSFLSVSTDFDLGRNWRYSITPAVGFNYNYDWRTLEDGNNLAQDSVGNFLNREDFFQFKIDHSISWGRVDWEGPFRNGYSISLANHNALNLSRPALTNEDSVLFVSDVDLTAKYYVSFLKILNYYTSGKALVSFNEVQTGLGHNLRGVKNSTMSGNMGFFWRNTLAIQPHRPNPNFNFQLHPFIDTGMSFDYRETGRFSEMLRIGAGGELVLMIGSIDIRARIGYDFLSDFIDFSFATGLTY